MSIEHLDTVFFHQPADTPLQLSGNIAGTFDDDLQVRLCQTDINPKAARTADKAQHVSTAQQRFGRDAAPIQTDPA
ncbi:hypothetical protein D3C84_1162020 [compost metagenome]